MTDVKITLHGGSLRIIRPRGNRTLDRAETEALRAFFAAEGQPQPQPDREPSAALEDGDALLARFSLPELDVEKVLRVFVETARGPMTDSEWALARMEAHSALRVYANAMVAAIENGELA